MTAERYIRQYAQEFMKLDRKFWNYEDGCVLTGLEAMYKATGRKCYAEAVRVFLDRYICPDGRIRWYDREEYSLTRFRPAAACSFCIVRQGRRSTGWQQSSLWSNCGVSPGQNPEVSGIRRYIPARYGWTAFIWRRPFTFSMRWSWG